TSNCPAARASSAPFLTPAQPRSPTVDTSWPTISRAKRRSTHSSRSSLTRKLRLNDPWPILETQQPVPVKRSGNQRESRQWTHRPRGNQAMSGQAPACLKIPETRLKHRVRRRWEKPCRKPTRVRRTRQVRDLTILGNRRA